MKYYFYIAFYSGGKIRCFNTKNIPKPINKSNGEKLISVKKFKGRL